ncbi:hypothetical protein [Endozoicomonas numazuensis]|uniref:Uncharacterized protein n=1 Tax=Endozoicomonas numazuensis TaxID=1137799 RepID=A0A081NCH3_9GAMM|nr:hypothetical protein [Endozoicomonas numazuensis]KEQ16146.1 hypothetical protein GZ78_23090 [Endozoicomonas numazuensis]
MTKCSPEFLSLADDCLRQFAQTGNDALSSILTPQHLNAFQASHSGFRARDFPPTKTLTLFMRQVASNTKSCRHALIDEARDQVVRGNKPSSTETSAYTKARQRLTEVSKRRILITDGSTLLMPDTEKNHNEYPQPSTQKKGLVSPSLEFLF